MIDLEKLKLILQSSYQPIAQSSRRLLKVHSDGGMDGRYKPSSTGSHVSGVLLWFNYKYFFLTARHCLQKFRDELGNEIPLNNDFNSIVLSSKLRLISSFSLLNLMILPA